jgi:hypothetical protein
VRLRCECGFEVRGDDAETLAAAAVHAASAHGVVLAVPLLHVLAEPEEPEPVGPGHDNRPGGAR